MKLAKIFFFGVVFWGAGELLAQSDLQLGARPQGMGGAYVALANDANAVFWNPAGLSRMANGEATFMHWNFAEITQLKVDYLSLAYPLPRGTVGLSWVRQGAELEEGPALTTSMMSENSFLLSYGLFVTSRLSVGMGINRLIINSKIGGGGGFGFDFGGLYYLIKDRWTIAAVAKNMAGSKKNEFFRPYYMFGSALQFHTRNDYHHFSLVFDLSTKEDIDGKEGMAIKYAGGIEYLLRLNNIALALRGGGGSKSTSYGFGFSVNSVSIDYAFVQMREKTIGDSHKFGVSFKFGKLMERRSSRPSRTIQSEKAQQERIRLTGSIRGDKVHLKWTPVSGSDGYQVLVRKSGTKFRPLHKGVLNTTEMTISAGKRDTEFEFIVKVVSKGKGVAVSNVLRLK